jgi:hypothetical protein
MSMQGDPLGDQAGLSGESDDINPRNDDPRTDIPMTDMTDGAADGGDTEMPDADDEAAGIAVSGDGEIADGDAR